MKLTGLRTSSLQPMNLLFVFLGGLILLFILAPLLGMFLATTPTQVLETAGRLR